MKKRTMLMLLALVLVLGLSGTLIHAKGQMEVGEDVAVKASKKETTVAPEPEDKATRPPVITGEKDWEVYQGEEINVLKGVSAKDYQNKTIDVTASPVSTEKVGEHKVVLRAEDKANKQTTTVTIMVKVKAQEQVSVEESSEPVSEPVIDQPSPAPEVVVEEIVEPAEETPAPEVVAEPSEPTWSPNTMYLGGMAISYTNAGQGSGQSVIDNNPNMIATWGGAALQSGSDGANTHFIGHNPGIFSVLFSLGGGSEIIVTDGSATPTAYVVNQIVEVDDYATRMDTGENISEQLIGSGGGERITLQTCVNDDVNLIVFASAN